MHSRWCLVAGAMLMSTPSCAETVLFHCATPPSANEVFLDVDIEVDFSDSRVRSMTIFFPKGHGRSGTRRKLLETKSLGAFAIQVHFRSTTGLIA